MSLLRHWVSISIVFVGLAIKLLGKVRNPLVDGLLRLLEALLNVLADLGEVVCEKLAPLPRMHGE